VLLHCFGPPLVAYLSSHEREYRAAREGLGHRCMLMGVTKGTVPSKVRALDESYIGTFDSGNAERATSQEV